MLSIPLAMFGGYINPPPHIFKPSSASSSSPPPSCFIFYPGADAAPHAPPCSVALAIGAGLGLLSGLTATVGGIFLTPLLIFMRWSHAKTASAVSGLFILVNSVAGLIGKAMESIALQY